MSLDRGARLGPYEVLGSLGAGGMGEVYRARDPRLGREVAIKVIRSDSEPDADRRRRFEDEARAAGALNHPNVLSVLDVGVAEGQPYVVFELLEGETLADRLERGPLPARRAIDSTLQVCQGLAAAHAKGIVHRDLKPANLFLGRDGQVKILDFGLAKLTHGETHAVADEGSTGTQPGLILGTLAYLSPEQARGEGADLRSDVFALGATLYEMLSGRPAFRRATAAETVSAILTHDPEALSASKEPLPAGLETIVRRCLEKDPEQRFQSARDLGFALSAVAGSTASGAGSPVPPPRRARWLLVVGLVLAAGAGASYLLRSRATATPSALMPVPFTAYPGLEFAPTFSPDGSQIAFAWSPEGTEDKVDLYTKVIGSEKALRLTTSPSYRITPAWSPDGRSIAYARIERLGVGGIYLIPALGGPARRLAAIPFDYDLETALSWSPDGKLLAFSDGPPQASWGVSILDMATQQKRRLGQPDASCASSWMPAFSPDGSSLAWVCTLSIHVSDVFVEPVSGGTARRVAHVNGFISGIAWSGDGKSLVIAALGNLMRFSIAGGEPQRLLSEGDVETPAISRDGRRLAYARHVVNTNIWRVPLTPSPAAVLPPTPLISSTRAEYLPAFSPDGRRLAFNSTRSGSSEVWISDADGSNPRQVTSFGGPTAGSPRWSPDGRWVALDSRATGLSDIYVVDSEGGTPRRLETGQADSVTPFWSSDGEWLYFSAPADGTDQVFKVGREGGRAIRLTQGGGLLPQSAPDGKRIYYWRNEKGTSIWSVSSSGGDERPVAGMPPLAPELFVSWALGPNGIHFLEGGSPPGVVFFDFATARARRVADLPGPPLPWAGIALSPDGRSVLFSKVERGTSDIMLIEGFR